ncbi:MAG: MFS transporter [Candidatus Doudnabacteria bacterium]|nr:MFS transporter [Candidatus Doudnabacteria bacterium]
MFHFKHHPHYFSYHLNREVEEVYWHSVLWNLALSIVFIFEPIYLFSLGYSPTKILWFYALVYFWYAILISFGAKFASRMGYKHAIFVSNVFYVIYWLILFSIRNVPELFYVAPIFFALQKSLFWPAYDADIALASVKSQRGREVGALFSLIQFAFILGPFIGGFLSHNFGFFAMFGTASALMLFSVYPLFRSSEIYSRHEFSLKNLWHVVRAHIRNFFGYWGYAEDLMVMSLWPVYMFIVIPSFLNVGVVSTIATILGAVLMLYIGKLIDKRTDKRSLIEASSIFYAVTWLFRALGKNVPTVLAFDVLTKTAKDAVNVPMMSLTYEKAASKSPDHAIAYSVFYEFSLSIGKIVTALLGIAILSAGGSIFMVFAMAGILTMFYALLR